MNKYTEEALIQTICRMAMEMTEKQREIEDLRGALDKHRQRAFKFAEEGLRAEARVKELENIRKEFVKSD
jgi:hypothetical protein